MKEVSSEHFNCTECSFEFTSKLDLQSHIQVNHRSTRTQVRIEPQPKSSSVEDVAASIACPFCHLMSKDLKNLKIHINNVHCDTSEEKNDTEK